jgi:small subunit ribosomal protein S16
LRELPVVDKIRAFFNRKEDIPMVVIRLARSGAKKRPFFNMVVTDSRNRRDGRFIERIGFYNPKAAASEKGLVVDAARLAFWQGNGAQLSPTAARLVKQSGVTVAAA